MRESILGSTCGFPPARERRRGQERRKRQSHPAACHSRACESLNLSFPRMRESILLVSCDFGPEIMPLWVALFDQIHLPLAVPLLDLLLAVDCLSHVSVEFIVDQAVNGVPLREPICEVVSVFIDTSHKVTRHPGVQCPVKPACQNVDGRLFCRHIPPFLSFPRMSLLRHSRAPESLNLSFPPRAFLSNARGALGVCGNPSLVRRIGSRLRGNDERGGNDEKNSWRMYHPGAITS